MSNKRLSKANLEKMKKDYMNYVPVTVIAETYNVSRSTVLHHANKGWEEQRGLKRSELYRNLADSKQVDFNKITGNTIKVLKRSLAQLADRTEPPTMKEALDASKILDVLDKITRLDEGAPTDIISNHDKPITIVELQKKIAVDPFAVEYKPEEEDSNEHISTDRNTNKE
jgi:uncharacterized protein (DUF2249 family)